MYAYVHACVCDVYSGVFCDCAADRSIVLLHRMFS